MWVAIFKTAQANTLHPFATLLTSLRALNAGKLKGRSVKARFLDGENGDPDR